MSPLLRNSLQIAIGIHVLGFVCLSLHANAPEPSPVVNWIQLVAHSSNYDGTELQLRGWLSVYVTADRTVFRLFMSREAMDYGDISLSVALESKSFERLLPEPRDTWQEFNGEYVLVQGCFRLFNPKTNPNPGALGELDKISYAIQIKPGTPSYLFKK